MIFVISSLINSLNESKKLRTPLEYEVRPGRTLITAFFSRLTLSGCLVVHRTSDFLSCGAKI